MLMCFVHFPDFHNLSYWYRASTAFLIPWSLLPDAIDEDPEKPAGLYTTWMVLIQKIGIALVFNY